MIGEYTTAPTWMYKPVQINNLAELQSELKVALYTTLPAFNFMQPAFTFMWRKDIEPLVPLYCEYLKSIDLFEQWNYSVFISTNANIPFAIHVDSTEWESRCYGLNVPVINCEGTSTIFYNAEIEDDPIAGEADPSNAYRLVKQSANITEIGRLDSSQPAWVNISVPHAPFSTHAKPRAILSSRFTPELHDLLYK